MADRTTKFSTGRAAASFTSTSLTPVVVNEGARLNEEEVMFEAVKGKGLVRMQTNLGDLDFELQCELAPRTCYNFMQLSKTGYYRMVPFHRSIKHFMIQGGDPTGTGRGGESIWKGEFADEIKNKLSHDSRGVLSMANHGPNTNSSQFFVTYRPCKHLDGKHTVFGKVVAGLSTLDVMETRLTDAATERPLEEIRIIDCKVLEDPFEDYRQRQARKQQYRQQSAEGSAELRKRKQEETTTWFGTKVGDNTAGSSGCGGGPIRVGKYLAAKRKAVAQADPAQKAKAAADITPTGPTKKSRPEGYQFGNFGNW
ncbi:cyclophilin peptidyl-prolyl cis-trans isomerase Cyp8 [Tieghemiomyces parasiticus]|uniref:Cyclophilin peptidyl-prolyl cis-trans isomerase Cyp8 n=1 Tax=Tieghemiomyces parasiticus TaxID=78921 RepID=A0A9W8A9B0_9FUNG|nr:cyclophilin peptidyl-prolyl cis-trans isomerase Cyp8 [Tieghemiomyces parasiticus]